MRQPLVALLAALVAAFAPAPASAAEQPRLALSRTAAPPDARVVVAGHGFERAKRVRLTLAGVAVKRGRTGAHGGFRFRVRVPSKRAGRVRLRAYSAGHVTSRRFRITARATEPTPLLPWPQPSPPESAAAPPPPPPPPPPPSPPTLVAAGDIACRPDLTETAARCHHGNTATLVESLGPDAVAALGDNQYEHGELENYQAAYNPTWGRFKPITFPAVGNHEYEGDPERDSAPG